MTALLVAAIWGANFSVIEIALESLPPLLFAAIRFGLVGLVGVLWLPRPTGNWRAVVAFGLLMGLLQFGALFFAMDGHADAGSAALVLQAQVPFTLILATLLLGESMDRSQAIGVAVAAIGLALFFDPVAGRMTAVGFCLTLFAAFSMAMANLIMRTTPLPGMSLVAWGSLVPALPLALLSLSVESGNPWRTVLAAPAAAWWSLAFVAVVATLLAFGLWGWLLARHRASSVIPFALGVPVFAQLVGSAWLGEPVTFRDAIAFLLIIAGAIGCLGRARPGKSATLGASTDCQPTHHGSNPPASECASRL